MIVADALVKYGPIDIEVHRSCKRTKDYSLAELVKSVDFTGSGLTIVEVYDTPEYPRNEKWK